MTDATPPKIKPLQSIRGMNDILPEEAAYWERLERNIQDAFARYGYQPLRLPIVEPTPLFTRAIGEVTDIVEKEMYSFTDSLNGEALTLRPEGTAGCVRAVIEHGLANQAARRFYYSGPMFRHERPQKDRYRQFYQVGVEAFGLAGPDIDAEQLLMLARLWQSLGIRDGIRLEVNSLGQPEERRRHRAELIAYFERHAEQLDEDARRRLYSNPLRILDSKNPAMQELCVNAPRLMDFLGDVSRAHFDGVRAILTAAGIPHTINPRLVRGLDYYNLTVFEWVTDRLGAQGTVCAGGRYDGLVEQLGGKPTPACGFAMGLERLVSLLCVDGEPLASSAPDAYVVHQGEAASAWAWKVAEALRDAGLAVLLHCGGGSFKSQMKKADASGARFACVIGDDEAAARDVQLKALRDREPAQERLSLAAATERLISILK